MLSKMARDGNLLSHKGGAMSLSSPRPFRLEVPENDLDDLTGRLARTPWPDELSDLGWERGVPVAYLRDLAAY